jgi:hypothetical protein
LLNGTYTLTQEGDRTIDGEVNELGVHQDLDQSPENPKASVEVEEGKHQSALIFFAKLTSLLFAFMLCYVHLSFRS